MPRLVHRLPAYRLHRPSGQAIVSLSGKEHYLGPHGSKTSKAEYDRLVAEWLANGRQPLAAPPDAARSLTISELVLRYWIFAKEHYRGHDGRPTREVDNIRDSLRQLRAMYGHTPAASFGPMSLKALRREMIDAGLARTTINFRVSKIRRTFRWAAENELITPAVYQALMAVAGLMPGRDGVRDTEGVKTVPEAYVTAVLPHVSKPIRAMIELQNVTGMRPGEVAAMRGADIDRSADVWVYRPEHHKTKHRGCERTIVLGPKAQAILQPWLKDDPAAYVFDPRDAVADRNTERRQKRKTPLTPSQAKRRPKRNRKRPPRERYDKNAYGQAIRRACMKANVPCWRANQLRHNVATRVRQRYGLESARLLLGHRSSAVTEGYAEPDMLRVVQIMGEIG